ncbi:O-antigen polymerase [Acinetobacter indicus]|uniref:O-antigen polymerase n=1 Tax=Acinetobacter indicus TaxID=756892 RepID=UPI0025784629|nr:O-antigen polymerase [Acinetobacter indicus]MDM1772052.1 oligosaccharide repeat unit polymerase [Acinetobacter indicus]MDM1774931.1 oligosaccharide repeat unit polymerase [Acinetobacter indicus]
MVYLTGLLILIVCVLIQFLLVKKKGVFALVNNPIGLSIIFYEIIHIIMPILQWDKSYFRYASSYDESIYIISMAYSFLLYICFIFLFFYFFNFFSKSPQLFLIKGKNSKNYLRFVWLIFLIGVYFSFNNILRINSIGIDEYMSDRIGFSAGSGYKTLFSHWVYVACILFYIGSMVSDKKKLFIISFATSFSYCLLYYGINSNRNSIFVLVLTLIVIFTIFGTYKKISRLALLVRLFFVSLVCYLLYLVGEFRNTAFNRGSDDYGLVRSLNGAFGNHENIVWLLSNKYEVLLGNTYIASFLNLIPRALWPNKPFGGGPELKNMIYPGSYVLGQEGNSSLTTGLITEVLMNFGILGSIPAVFIISIFIFIILVCVKKSKNPILTILFIYLFTLFSTQFLYAEFLGFYTRTLFTCIPIIMLAFFVKFERKAL